MINLASMDVQIQIKYCSILLQILHNDLFVWISSLPINIANTPQTIFHINQTSLGGVTLHDFH